MRVDCGKDEQEDEKLSDTFSDAGPVPEASATGAVKGNKVVSGWYVEESRTSYTAVFKGALYSTMQLFLGISTYFGAGRLLDPVVRESPIVCDKQTQC